MLIDLDNIMNYYPKIFIYSDSVKSVSIRSYSGSDFPAFGLNTERYGVYGVYGVLQYQL